MYQLSTQFQGNITKVVHIFVFITIIKPKGGCFFFWEDAYIMAGVHLWQVSTKLQFMEFTYPSHYKIKIKHTFNEMVEEQSIHAEIQSFLPFFLCIAYTYAPFLQSVM